MIRKGKASSRRNSPSAIREDRLVQRTAKKIRLRASRVKEADELMRSRKELAKDFRNAMPARKDEFLSFQREKILLELLLDIRDYLCEIAASVMSIEKS